VGQKKWRLDVPGTVLENLVNAAIFTVPAILDWLFEGQQRP
jgi:hypothetical protein